MQQEIKLLRLPQVLDITGLKRSTLYNLISQGKFDKGVKISERCKAWDSQKINDWIQSKLNHEVA